MKTFALIAEGITDQAVLQIVLESFYEDEVDVNPLQPRRNSKNENRQDEDSFGGWENVFAKCAEVDGIMEALLFNDYLVIQIDTDVCEHRNFGVSYRVDGRERSIPEIIEAVKMRIISLVDRDVYERNSSRFVFAIAVHSLECWLLPVHGHTQASKKKVVNCEEHLRRCLAKSKMKYEKEHGCYLDLAKDFRIKSQLVKFSKENESFAIFLSSLPRE